MKNKLGIGGLIIIFIALLTSCKKDTLETEINQPPTSVQDNYSSMSDFFAKNGVQMQTDTIDAVAGGSFTTPQGTHVTIAPNAFSPVTGKIQIEFKDVYKKSDMLMSLLSTDYFGMPLKSGGMFFIKATSNNVAVQLAFPKGITVEQPFGSFAADSSMLPFVGFLNPQLTWQPANDTTFGPSDSLRLNGSGYVFSMYHFQSPLDSGTWCNSDNQTYFSSYPNTVLTSQPTDNPDTFQTDVFLVFKNIDCMIHVYRSGNNFTYSYAPKGLECSIVAVGEKGGTLYSSFTPITIGSNQTVNFTLSATTTAAFKTQLRALD